jgi:hypothetical protein
VHKRVYEEPEQQDSDCKKPVYGTVDDMKKRAGAVRTATNATRERMISRKWTYKGRT